MADCESAWPHPRIGITLRVRLLDGSARSLADALLFINFLVDLSDKRAEVWDSMLAWLREGAQIPDDPELEIDLTGLQYGFSGKGQLQLEKKSDMKARGLASPDLADCLAMSFARRFAKSKPAAEFPNYRPRSGGADGWMAI